MSTIESDSVKADENSETDRQKRVRAVVEVSVPDYTNATNAVAVDRARSLILREVDGSQFVRGKVVDS